MVLWSILNHMNQIVMPLFDSFLSAPTVVFSNVSFSVSICLIPFVSFNCFLRSNANTINGAIKDDRNSSAIMGT